jgi:para-nitrobenzyl esterase
MLRIAKTEAGLVRGIPAADPRITAFKGIPFAAPPVGNLRWKAPQPPIPWEGIRDCLEFGPIAMQDTPGLDPDNIYTKEWHVDPTVPMNEDCLQLNIWTPMKTGEERLPVMVWIFGGGLQWGYPSEMEFDGERIARRGVVFVSLNYRLSLFGFLAHPELTAENPDAPCANWGLLDQKAGIDWVRRNIANFGGDPNNITIFGQSAGGGSVLTHLASPMAKGSFQKAIVQSGGGMFVSGPGLAAAKKRDAMPLAEAEKVGIEFFEFLGVKSLAEARQIDALTLVRKNQEFREFGEFSGFWGIVLDGKYVPASYTKIFLKGKQHNIPVIIGNTSNEFITGLEDGTLESLRELGRQEFGDDAVEGFVEACMKETGGDMGKLKDAVKLNIFEVGSHMFCQNAVEKGFKDVYYYSFEPSIPGDDAGAFHSVDLWFSFETLAKCWRPFTGKHYDLARRMCTYWTNFAKTGDPNGLDADGTPLPQWRPYSNQDKAGIILGDEVKMQQTGPGALLSWLIDYNFDKIKHLR